MATKAAKETPKTEVATVSNSLPATMDASMLAADAGLGRESMSITDMALPYLLILQSLSPQVKKSSPQRVDGAEEGDIFNTVTQELFASEDGINVIPCAFQKAWVEWAPRDSGGGCCRPCWSTGSSSRRMPRLRASRRPALSKTSLRAPGWRPARRASARHGPT